MKVHIDKTFDSKLLNKYDLNLNIGDGLIVADVLKTKSKTHIAVAEKGFENKLNQKDFHIANFTKALKTYPIRISKQYGKVSISIANTLFSVIPKALFNKESTHLYLKLSATIKQPYEYKYHILEKEGIVICYALPKNLNDWIKKVFPSAKLTHEIAVVVESVLRDFYSLSEDRVIINLHKDYFDIIFLTKGKLKLVNSFHFSGKEDLLYYILFSFEQLDINPNVIEVFLIGEINKGGEEHQLLFQYIKNLHFGFRNKNIKIAGALNELPNHYFYTIFNLGLCV
ncbi:MAG: hypothetical protein CMD20_00115 [Flavobacteriales bacterium]|nr:hypothetical protein [Flavobacteriales bacterium]